MFAPPAVAAMAGRLVDALPHRSFVSPTVNLAITNVPGPRQPVHLAGQPAGVEPPGDVDQRPARRCTSALQSGPDVVGIGAVACRDNLDDLGGLLAGGAARAGRRSSPPSAAGERRLALLLERRDALGVVGGAGDASLGRALGGEHGGELHRLRREGAHEALGLAERLGGSGGDRLRQLLGLVGQRVSREPPG